MKVYLAIEDVHYESTTVLGIFESEASALQCLTDRAEWDRANGAWYGFVYYDSRKTFEGSSCSLRIEEEEVRP